MKFQQMKLIIQNLWQTQAAGQGVDCPDAPETKGTLPFTGLIMEIHGLKHGNGLIRILFPGQSFLIFSLVRNEDFVVSYYALEMLLVLGVL
jgi:hypothetical protein